MSKIVPLSGNNPVEDMEWNQIVERILTELEPDHMPDKVIRATEMLLAGYPVNKAAKELGIQAATIRRWMTQYPTVAAVIANGRKLLSRWRMAKLEQQFLKAVNVSWKVLDLNLDGTTKEGTDVDAKVLGIVAAQSRYIIGLFAGQKLDIEVRHEVGDSVLKAQQNAMDYLAQQLAAQQARAADEPIEVTYRVIDPKLDVQGPLLTEKGDPPFGELGKLDTNDDGTLCHICNKRFKSLVRHVLGAHNMGSGEYETYYMLEPGSLRRSEHDAHPHD